MTLEQFKARATAAELCLIERIEQLVVEEARKKTREEVIKVARDFRIRGHEDFVQAIRRFFEEVEKP